MKHVVVAIIKRDNPLSYLLVSSKKDHGEFSGFYYPPGGHIEGEESESIALERELEEELSIKLSKATKLTETLADVKDQKTSWYVCEVEYPELSLNKEDLRDATDFTEAQINGMIVWPATLEVFRKHIFKT